MRHLRLALFVIAVMVAGAGSSLAQRPVYGYQTVPAPRTVYVVPRQRPSVVVYPRYQTRSYVTTWPGTYRVYTTTPVRTSRPLLPFRRYQQSINAGQDPNWAAGRGVRLYKPWEY